MTSNLSSMRKARNRPVVGPGLKFIYNMKEFLWLFRVLSYLTYTRLSLLSIYYSCHSVNLHDTYPGFVQDFYLCNFVVKFCTEWTQIDQDSSHRKLLTRTEASRIMYNPNKGATVFLQVVNGNYYFTDIFDIVCIYRNRYVKTLDL